MKQLKLKSITCINTHMIVLNMHNHFNSKHYIYAGEQRTQLKLAAGRLIKAEKNILVPYALQVYCINNFNQIKLLINQAMNLHIQNYNCNNEQRKYILKWTKILYKFSYQLCAY
jgi:hypothetical protein